MSFSRGKPTSLNRTEVLSSLLSDLEKLAINKSAVPGSSEIDTWTKRTSTSYVSAFGSYKAAVDHSGIRTDEPDSYAQDVIAADLYRVAIEFECRPPTDVLLELLPYSQLALEKAFKSMHIAWRAAKNAGPSRLPREVGPVGQDQYRRELLSDAEKVFVQSGALQPTDIAAHSRFSPETYLTFFGSWSSFIKATDGYETESPTDEPETARQNHQDVSEAYTNPTMRDILADLWYTASQSENAVRLGRRFYKKEGGIPLEKIEEVFGSFPAAMQIAGLERRTNPDVTLTWYPPFNIDLVTEIERVGQLVDGRLTKDDMNRYGKTSVAAYIQRFGSWENTADILSSLENIPNTLIISNTIGAKAEAVSYRDYTEDDLLDAIEELARDVGTAPTCAQMSEHGAVSYNAIVDHFGSWKSALSAADIPYTSAGIERRKPISEIIDEIDGLGKSGVLRLSEAGYNTVGDVYEAPEDELMETDSIGPKIVENLRTYLER